MRGSWGYITLFLSTALFEALALDSNLCQVFPKEKHCLIEYPVRQRWPHTERFVYNWTWRRCFKIYWSEHCHPLPSLPTANNFHSEDQCMQECSGWA